MVQHYYAIAEGGQEGDWFLTFPDGGTGYSHADSAKDIVAQAQDWLASAAMYGGQLPLSIEAGAKPPADLLLRAAHHCRGASFEPAMAVPKAA